MKAFLFCVALLAPMLGVAKVNVVTTIPDYAVLAQEVGGKWVAVTSLARATEDAHFVDPKPSFIRLLNRADLLIASGAELEIGWLPPLMDSARNAKILPGRSGHLAAAEGLKLLDVPTGPVDRSQGDVHASGNPHFTLDPLNGVEIARRIAARLQLIDPEHSQDYQQGFSSFEERLKKKMEEWETAAAPLKGAKALTYHKTYNYLAQRFGMEVVGQIEPKPGIEPSPSHIRKLIMELQSGGVQWVVVEPNRSHKTAEYLARNIGAKVVVLPGMIEQGSDGRGYIEYFDQALKSLLQNVRQKR